MYYGFNENQLDNDMNNIYKNLTKQNATKLIFDCNQIATRKGTNLIEVNGFKVKNNFTFSVAKDHNIYFIFNENFECEYVGKAMDNKINESLNYHLIKNNTNGRASAIDEVCNYLNGINGNRGIIYLITFEIQPLCMVAAVESYFIEKFKNLGLCNWRKRTS